MVEKFQITLSIHFVKLLWICPQQTSISFLANKQIWIIDLLKLQLDGLRNAKEIETTSMKKITKEKRALADFGYKSIRCI